MKRLVALCLTALFCLSLSGARAGTAADPLLSLSFIEEELNPAVQAQGEEIAEIGLAEATANAFSAVESLGYAFSYGNTPFVLSPGGQVALRTGSSVILGQGAAILNAERGTVIDLRTAQEFGATALSLSTRYFCAEDTEATVTATERSLIYVNGDYLLLSGASPLLTAYGDVKVQDWFYDYVAFVRERGLYHDLGEASFRPNEQITRAELVYALWRSIGGPMGSTAAFADVAPEAWYAQAVSWAAENGIVNGYGNERFGPENSLTREQAAAIFYRMAGYLEEGRNLYNDLTRYEDWALVSDWAQTPLRWANARGLIEGVSSTRLAPQGTATRAQLAAILMRFI